MSKKTLKKENKILEKENKILEKENLSLKREIYLMEESILKNIYGNCLSDNSSSNPINRSW